MISKLNLTFNKVSMYLVAALLASTSAYSIPKEPCDILQPPACCEKVQPGPFAFTYPKDVGLACPRDFYVFGDLLFLKAAEDGLDYAIEDSTAGSVAFPVAPGNIHGMSTQAHDWNWNYGARAGFGFYLNHDQWNIETRWMYLRINNDKTSYAPGETLSPLWAPVQLITTSERASERWTATMNIFDICLGKPFHASRYFVLNPNFGIRAAWIDQDLLTRYSWFYSFPAHPFVSNGIVEISSSNNYWGVGIRGGLNSEFLLGSGWALFGNFGLSMLFSKFEIKQDSNGFVQSSNGDFEVHNDFYSNVPNLDLTFGMSFSHLFSKNKNMMSFKLAYEFHEWFQQNHLRRFYSNTNFAYNQEVVHGDLTLNGLSFRVQFDF